jgi:KDO2-lipid IV(A) lauroyltransferase
MKKFVSLVFLSISRFIVAMPPEIRALMGDGIGILWFDVFRIRRKVALDNLRLAFPDWSEKKRMDTARMSMRHLGRSIVEFGIFPFYEDSWFDRFFEYQGIENLNAALAQGKGALLLGLHLGNGDFAISALAMQTGRINLISKSFRSAWLNELWFGLRRSKGTKFISHEKSSFDILRALKRNEAVIFVLDQFMGPPIGVRTRFFGHETGTAAGLALMAQRTEAPVLPVYTYRKPNGKSVLVFEKPMVFAESGLNDSQGQAKLSQLDRDKSISLMTQAYTDKIEGIIRQHPEQWMWIHRRWKEFRD